MPIVVAGARTHNLKNLSCTIPHAALTVVTGVSGSGKSSLAFSTIYAEGQRRFVESLSTYARQFLERMERPDVDQVSGVPPAIAIEQRNGVRNARSTVGTITEISDYLRLLFARIGQVHCPTCGGRVLDDSAQAAATVVLTEASGERLSVVAPLPPTGDVGRLVETLLRAGHRRLLLEGTVKQLDEYPLDELRGLGRLPVLIDRLRATDEERQRLCDSLAAAFALSSGRAELVVEGRAEPLRFAEGLQCVRCSTTLRAPEPALFSPSSPLGACPTCQGFGRAVGIDYDKVIPDPTRTLREGAIVPFTMPSNAECQDELLAAITRSKRARADVPWRALTDEERAWVIDGEAEFDWRAHGKTRWYGVRRFFDYLERKKYKMHVRVLLARYRGYTPCPSCGGDKLRAEARAVLVGGRNLPSIEALPIGELSSWLASLPASLSVQQRKTAEALLTELAARVGFLDEVGLGYLQLQRQARTLSGGEAQRIALGAALGSRLTGTLYVLDEPSVGLHPRDTQRLLGVLGHLVARGNTVIVVEHDPEVMAAADHILDLGPRAGAHGGALVFAGTYDKLLVDRHSITGAHLRQRREGRAPLGQGCPASPGVLRIEGAAANNLRGVDVEIPLGRLTCLAGVSGSGKSSLLVDVLYANAMRELGRPVDSIGACRRIVGLDQFEDVLLVDQSPLQRSSRSNPATYLRAMDELRQRFAATDDAQRLGLGAGAFSFNVARENGGGRCEACQGQGTLVLDMHFLADITVVCDKCDGRRFGERVLGVRYAGLTIRECLDLTVDEALRRFANDARLQARLQPFVDVGLGYLTLGQPTSTLSGGELQRLKLAAHLADAPPVADDDEEEGTTAKRRRGAAAKGTKRSSSKLTKVTRPLLFLLDEPTSGLHGRDVDVLLAALGRLLRRGHTIVTIEHNLDFLQRADHVIELGPEAGAGGGALVVAGTVDEVQRHPTSHTGAALRAMAKAPMALRPEHFRAGVETRL